ncbi:hypothetical protein CDS [Bradyrhizobium sp.]|nr:hypothetical protein [Bradyrhizobium sp.]CUU20094.1 hypothetical protein CDS [Bradyrhizobium sp.]
MRPLACAMLRGVGFAGLGGRHLDRRQRLAGLLRHGGRQIEGGK